MKKVSSFLFPIPFFVLIFFAGCGGEDDAVDCLLAGPGVVVSSSTDPTCTSPGSITASSSGGKAPVVYSLNGVDFQEEVSFEQLAAGPYVVTAKDANGCTSSTSVSLSLQSDLALSLLPTEAGCAATEGTLTIEASGGIGDYSYSIDGGDFQGSPFFDNLASGIHAVVVKDGVCTAEAEALVPSGISFEGEISAIIANNCALEACHGGTQAPDFRVFANIQENAENIMIKTSNRTMPPASPEEGQEPLTEAQIEAIACWVTDGAKEN